MSVRNYELFDNLPEITAEQVTKFDHAQLSKVQKKLSNFLNTCMSRLDIVSTRYMQDFLNFDITGTLSLTTINEVNTHLSLAYTNLLLTNY